LCAGTRSYTHPPHSRLGRNTATRFTALGKGGCTPRIDSILLPHVETGKAAPQKSGAALHFGEALQRLAAGILALGQHEHLARAEAQIPAPAANPDGRIHARAQLRMN